MAAWKKSKKNNGEKEVKRKEKKKKKANPQIAVALLGLGVIVDLRFNVVNVDLVELKVLKDALLEGILLLLGEGVSLGNDGNDVHPLVEPLQEIDVESLQAVYHGKEKKKQL